jgi:hypothetical protein
MSRSFNTIFKASLFSFVFLLLVHLADAQVMQSTNYQIQSDSINVGGGLSDSSNYSLESTAGEIATGNSGSTNYQLRAGYQQMQEVFIAISGATTTILSPTIGGITGGIANGSTTVTVITDSPSGYSLTIQSEATPTLRSGANTILDYVPVGAVPDFTFITDTTDSQLGYSPEGVDVASRFLDLTGVCNSGTGNASLSCWDGLSTTSRVIATKSGSNHPLGATTTIHFRVGIGGSVTQAPGTYVGTTTLTAIPL